MDLSYACALSRSKKSLGDIKDLTKTLLSCLISMCKIFVQEDASTRSHQAHIC